MGRAVFQAFATVGIIAATVYGGPFAGLAATLATQVVLATAYAPDGSEGPRLDDLRADLGSFGVPILKVYGADRVQGNKIWQTDLEEHQETEGGGLFGGEEITTFTYSASFAIGLCEGPIAAVRKLWFDGKLLYDKSDTNIGLAMKVLTDDDPRELLDDEEREDRIDALLDQIGQINQKIRIYYGTETQLPSPLQEAVEGPNNVPAYRGLAYIEFEDLALGVYGNRIPNITAEVSTGVAAAYPQESIVPSPGLFIRDRLFFDQAREVLWYQYSTRFIKVDAFNNEILIDELVDTTEDAGYPLAITFNSGFTLDQDGYIYTSVGSGSFTGRVVRMDPTSLKVTHTNSTNIGLCSYLTAGQNFMWFGGWPIANPYIYRLTRPLGINVCHPLKPEFDVLEVDNTVNVSPLYASMIATDRDNNSWFLCRSYFGTEHPTILYKMTECGAGADDINLTADIKTASHMAYDPLTHSLIIAGLANGYPDTTTRVIRWDITSQSVDAFADGLPLNVWNTSSWTRGVISRRIWFNHADFTWQALDVDTLTIVRSETTAGAGGFTGNDFYGAIYDPQVDAIWVQENNVGFKKYYLNRITLPGVSLASIIQAVSAEVGLPSADLDTSLLTDIVHGYTRKQRASARSILEPLLQAYFVDTVESDWKVHFKPRKVSPAAILTAEDLGAHGEGDTPPEPLDITEVDPINLPVRIDLTYQDPAFDYQVMPQQARRMQANVQTRAQVTVTTPVLMAATDARSLVETMLVEAWVSTRAYKFSLFREWSVLDPCDVVHITTDNDVSHAIKLTKVLEGVNDVVECEGVSYDPDTYNGSGIAGGVSASFTSTMLLPDALTKLFFFDTALLRDTDSGGGFYIAGGPDGAGEWPGAVVFKSADNAAYTEVVTLTHAVTWGSALTALDDGSPYVFDRDSTVDIRMGHTTFALESVTELEALNGANAMLFGQPGRWEVIHPTMATQLTATTWRLGVFLRGRRGTEWATALHQVGDYLVVLDVNTVRRVDMGISELGLSRYYRGVTIGIEGSLTRSQQFTNTGNGLRPYAPNGVKGVRDESGNLVITWVRRTRVGGEWRDLVDVPLNEVAELYDVIIYDGPNVVRGCFINLTTPTVTYTAAEQTTDFGSPQSSIDIIIYQISDAVGRGYGRAVTV